MRAKLPVITAADQLPFHDELAAGEIVWGDENELLQVNGEDFAEPGGEFTRLRESVLTGCSVIGGSFASSNVRDVWFGTVRLAGTDLQRSEWLDSYVVGSAWSGIQASESTLRRVRFVDCKFDTVNFRGSKFLDVEFVDCELSDLDLALGSLTNVSFVGCRLRNLHLGAGERSKVDLSKAVELSIADGLEDLSGLTISRDQAEGLAVALAQRAGATVR
jgi:uncharacterized protein YjbI with pentapeptide repeats